MNEWDNLWEKEYRLPFSTTFGRAFPNGYTEGFVYDWLSGLSLGGDILEVGCGNASLVPFLLDNKIGESYTGVDSAKVHLSSDVSKRIKNHNLDIILHKQTPLENTSFIGRFDHVVSIYGIEYTHMFRTLPMVYESLKKDGHIHFMMHNSESSMTAFGKSQLRTHYTMEFDSTGDLIEDFRTEKIRHKQQVESSMDEKEIEVFKCNLEQTGFVNIKITEQTRKLAWLISAKRG